MSNSKLDRTKMHYSEYYRKLQQEKASEAEAVRDARVRNDDKKGFYSRGYEPYVHALLKTNGDSRNPVLESREDIYKKRLNMYLDLSNKKKVLNDAHYQDKQNETYLGALKSKGSNNLDSLILKLAEESPANQAITRTKLIENFKMIQISATDAQQLVDVLSNSEVYVMYNYWEDFVNSVLRSLSAAPTITLLARYMKKYIVDKLDDLDDSTRNSIVNAQPNAVPNAPPNAVAPNAPLNVVPPPPPPPPRNAQPPPPPPRNVPPPPPPRTPVGSNNSTNSNMYGNIYSDHSYIEPVLNPMQRSQQAINDLKTTFSKKSGSQPTSANETDMSDITGDESYNSFAKESDEENNVRSANYKQLLENYIEDAKGMPASVVTDKARKVIMSENDYRMLETLDSSFDRKQNRANALRILAYADLTKGSDNLYPTSGDDDNVINDAEAREADEIRPFYFDNLRLLESETNKMNASQLKAAINALNPPKDIFGSLKIVDNSVSKSKAQSWTNAKLPVLVKVYALTYTYNIHKDRKPQQPPPPPPRKQPPPPPPRLVRTVTLDDDVPPVVARKQPAPKKQQPETTQDLLRGAMKAIRVQIADDDDEASDASSFGMGLRKFRKGNNNNHIRLVIGKGATLKHDVDLKKLEKDTLCVRYKNNSNGYKVKPVKISPECKTVIMGIAMNETLNSDIFDSLQPREKRLIEHYVHQMKIPIHLDKKNLSELGERFEVLKGQLQSGNNSPTIKKMLLEVTNELYYFGYINKKLYESIMDKYC